MVKFVAYHGTSSDNANSIMSTSFKPSTADSHWLGDGVYYFIHGLRENPETQAEQWAILSAWDKESKTNKYEEYAIIESNICADDTFIWDFTEDKTLSVWEQIKNKLHDHLIKRAKNRENKIEFIDGFLINFLRNKGIERIDVCIADMNIQLTPWERCYKVRSRIPNCTICSVCNTSCITSKTIIKKGKVA